MKEQELRDEFCKVFDVCRHYYANCESEKLKTTIQEWINKFSNKKDRRKLLKITSETEDYYNNEAEIAGCSWTHYEAEIVSLLYMILALAKSLGIKVVDVEE